MKKRKDETAVAQFTFYTAAFCALITRVGVVFGDSKAYAQGNLFVVYEVKHGRFSEEYPPHNNKLNDLWCQATRDDKTRVEIQSARFMRVLPRPLREHSAHVSDDQRAYLHFGDEATPNVAGKYRCEIVTKNGESVTGNLFLYLRPIFRTNGSIWLDQVDDDQPFNFRAHTTKVTRGEKARLVCPFIGYPPPTIRWQFNSNPLDIHNSSKYRQFPNGELHILSADDPDDGVYECVVQNSFPLQLDSAEHEFTARLQQQLKVKSSLSWLLPLLIIVAIIILVFLIIYTSAWWKRRQHDQYHVAKKEKCLPTTKNTSAMEDDDLVDE